MSANSSSGTECRRSAHSPVPVQRGDRRVRWHRHVRVSFPDPGISGTEDPTVAGRVHRRVSDGGPGRRGPRVGGKQHASTRTLLRGGDGDGRWCPSLRQPAADGVWSSDRPHAVLSVRSLSVGYEQHYRTAVSNSGTPATCAFCHQIRR